MIMGHRDPLDEAIAEGGVTVDGGGGGGVQSPTTHSHISAGTPAPGIRRGAYCRV
jgi:hypothetical protein